MLDSYNSMMTGEIPTYGQQGHDTKEIKEFVNKSMYKACCNLNLRFDGSMLEQSNYENDLYHSYYHLCTMITYLNSAGLNSTQYDIAILATVFHDWIQNKPNSEIESAIVALRFVYSQCGSISDDMLTIVYSIISTNYFSSSYKLLLQELQDRINIEFPNISIILKEKDIDNIVSRAVRKADLAILSAPACAYIDYCARIRAEYKRYSKKIFIHGRFCILAKLNLRKHIYLNSVIENNTLSDISLLENELEAEKAMEENILREYIIRSNSIDTMVHACWSLLKKFKNIFHAFQILLIYMFPAQFWNAYFLDSAPKEAWYSAGILNLLYWLSFRIFHKDVSKATIMHSQCNKPVDIFWPHSIESIEKPSILYAGSFNPIHKGHLELIRNAVRSGFRVIIVIAVNPNKKYPVSLDTRVNIVKLAIEADSFIKDQCIVESTTGLAYLVGCKYNCIGMLRGVRGFSDLFAEYQLGMLNGIHQLFNSYDRTKGCEVNYNRYEESVITKLKPSFTHNGLYNKIYVLLRKISIFFNYEKNFILPTLFFPTTVSSQNISSTSVKSGASPELSEEIKTVISQEYNI